MGQMKAALMHTSSFKWQHLLFTCPAGLRRFLMGEAERTRERSMLVKDTVPPLPGVHDESISFNKQGRSRRFNIHNAPCISQDQV